MGGFISRPKPAPRPEPRPEPKPIAKPIVETKAEAKYDDKKRRGRRSTILTSASGVSEERIYFHNWGGTLHGHSRHHTGTWDPGNNVYVNSAGWVTLRLLAGSYRGYVIDLVQHAWYNTRDITIRSYQTSNSSSI